MKIVKLHQNRILHAFAKFTEAKVHPKHSRKVIAQPQINCLHAFINLHIKH